MSLKLFPGACGIFFVLYSLFHLFMFFSVCDFFPLFLPYHDIAEILPEY
jgi:hypothetical protein